jgi:hypothetical protein
MLWLLLSVAKFPMRAVVQERLLTSKRFFPNRDRQEAVFRRQPGILRWIPRRN